MRGPALRIRYDVRRLWKCPQCGYERRVSAQQTTVRCHCQDGKFFMRLVEPQRTVRAAAPDLDRDFSPDDAETVEATESVAIVEAEATITETEMVIEEATPGSVEETTSSPDESLN